MFDDYLAESNLDNHIYLEFKTQAFAKAMTNSKNSKNVRVKLSCHRGVPGLLFDMEVEAHVLVKCRWWTESVFGKIST